MSSSRSGRYEDPGATSGHPRHPGTTGWVHRHRLISALIAVAVLGWTVDAATGVDRSAGGGSAGGSGSASQSDDESDTRPVEDESPSAEPAAASDKRRTGAAAVDRQRDKRTDPPTSPRHARRPTRAPQPRTYLVTRVIDGDTIELGNGAGVRIVGIDTPEVGQCGYDAATRHLSRLVLDERVRLTMSDESVDHYGRWLRYVDVGPVDAGLHQIEQGFAIARYDSRDGYGFHVREPAYIAADRASTGRSCVTPAPGPGPVRGGGCARGYAPCVPPAPPDVDCAAVDGPIHVTGADPHGLDADGDGVACE